MSALNDPRVKVDSYVIYPTDYDLIPFSDKFSFALEVKNGHAWGWSVRQAGLTGGLAMNRKGQWVMESRGSGHNKARRWSLEEALEIALKYVDTHKRDGMSAADAVARREELLAEFEQRRRGVQS